MSWERIWKAKLTLVPTKRLDQNALKAGEPEMDEQYTKEC